MFVLDPPYKSLQFPTSLQVHPSSSALGSRSQTLEAVAEDVDRWKGRLYAKKWIVITSIPDQNIDEAFANHN